MKILGGEVIRSLSFPDMQVREIEFVPEETILNVVVEGAWLEIDDGIELGLGTLVFTGWDAVSVNRFDAKTEQWEKMDFAEPLKDICEFRFQDTETCLRGFGKESNQWLEWKIAGIEMRVVFKED